MNFKMNSYDKMNDLKHKKWNWYELFLNDKQWKIENNLLSLFLRFSFSRPNLERCQVISVVHSTTKCICTSYQQL